jgi:hypothetical protein
LKAQPEDFLADAISDFAVSAFYQEWKRRTAVHALFHTVGTICASPKARTSFIDIRFLPILLDSVSCYNVGLQ